MNLQYKDFHRKMAPFREESLETLLSEQVNPWININNVKIISVETIFERNTHMSVGVRIWFVKE
ncbi:MAG: hypothetical protein NZL90_04050 [Aquificaceae bacterium]|nr:hypothetical protein [Aquificaceae bacterium]MDW8237523.1 hypothetical protein [Aquificaceae bacterium]